MGRRTIRKSCKLRKSISFDKHQIKLSHQETNKKHIQDGTQSHSSEIGASDHIGYFQPKTRGTAIESGEKERRCKEHK